MGDYHGLFVHCCDEVAEHPLLEDEHLMGSLCVGEEQTLPAATVSAFDTSLSNKLKELNQSVQHLKDANR